MSFFLSHQLVLLISSHGGGGGGGGGGDAGSAGDGGPPAHWPQVCAQLLWNHGRSHLCVFFSHHELGLMSRHGGGSAKVGGGGEGSGEGVGEVLDGEDEGGGGEGDVAASHWPQVIAQLVCIHGRWQL